MKCFETPIAGLLLFEPTVYPDDRGYFFEAFRDAFLKSKEFIALLSRTINQDLLKVSFVDYITRRVNFLNLS